MAPLAPTPWRTPWLNWLKNFYFQQSMIKNTVYWLQTTSTMLFRTWHGAKKILQVFLYIRYIKIASDISKSMTLGIQSQIVKWMTIQIFYNISYQYTHDHEEIIVRVHDYNTWKKVDNSTYCNGDKISAVYMNIFWEWNCVWQILKLETVEY